ncbi:MAG: phosphate ABC transporter permease subunit PstC [Crocinitomicaceae bacterium]|nr:phosphate ABC transporter permease subunit PstC [Crocinitomicaceae bacterium]
MIKNKFFKRLIEKGVEAMLTLSGAVTSIIILFMCIFLFVEGFGLFKSSTVEEGYSIYVNSENPVSELSPQELKQIFDSEVTNWKEFGGKDQAIRVYRFDEIFKTYPEEEMGEDFSILPIVLGDVVRENEGIVAFLPTDFAPEANNGIKMIPADQISFSDFFLGEEWLPTATPSPLFGLMPLLLGTLLVSLLAISIALPLGLGVAIYLSELADERTRRFMKPVIELLAGIPSVVYGFFGLVVLAPIIQKTFNLPVGETALTGGVILAIMALPTIISIAEDAMRNTPREMREASLALGATKWQTIYKVIIPYSKSGISAAVVLGIGRAIGETMAVLMVTGNGAMIPGSVFDSVRTIPATIAAELGEAPFSGPHYQSLFLLGCVLFVITMVISVASEVISKKQNYKH